MRTVAPPVATHAYRAGALAFLLATAAILTALAFEYIGGYNPCPLCLQQRYAYYIAIPTLFLALILYTAGRQSTAALVFLLISFAFVANAILGIYHSGAEWKFWPGPDTCAGTAAPLASSPGGLLKSLPTTRIIRCDEAPWRLFGLSFAGWNVVISICLWITALQAAYAAASDARLREAEKSPLA
ncbi:MAG: disulfide bond formation protein B [Hyphomicrobiaceae bacterium]|nr:disulfide bond formation protein B [Hyphomicrobiaceae bacterium]